MVPVFNQLQGVNEFGMKFQNKREEQIQYYMNMIMFCKLLIN